MQRLLFFAIVAVALQPTLNAATDNLLANGQFTQGTAHWEAENERLIGDPGNRYNQVIKIPIEDGVFALSQKLSLPTSVKSFRGSFRIRATCASPNEPVQVRVRIYNAQGDSIIIAAKTISTSETWETIAIPAVTLPPETRESLLIESNRGQGEVLIDDVTLRPQRP